jgi:hypothetical protein
MLSGAAVVIVGLALRGGNTSGAFPTFPFAGTLTMLLGAGLIAGGLKLAGRRAAILLGILMILAGAGLFARGLSSDDLFYHGLFPIAGVLVAALGGALVAAGAGAFSQPRS